MNSLISKLCSPIVRTWSQKSAQLQLMMQQFVPAVHQNFFPQLALADVAVDNRVAEKTEESLLDQFIWFAVPKSKVSRARKRAKHERYIPDTVAWVKCDRCGEPKRPHRICSTHADICGMRPEEYAAHKASQGQSDSTQ